MAKRSTSDIIADDDNDTNRSPAASARHWNSAIRVLLGLRLSQSAFLHWYERSDLAEKPPIWATDEGSAMPLRVRDLSARWASATTRHACIMEGHLIRSVVAGYFEPGATPETLCEGRDGEDATANPTPISRDTIWRIVAGSSSAFKALREEVVALSVADWQRRCDDFARSNARQPPIMGIETRTGQVLDNPPYRKHRRRLQDSARRRLPAGRHHQPLRHHRPRAEGVANAEQPKPVCPVTVQDFSRYKGDPLPLLVTWAEWRYPDRQYPGRKLMLGEFRKDVGTIPKVHEKTMGAVRGKLATIEQKKGGWPTHRRFRR
jgi:hypothetical protein